MRGVRAGAAIVGLIVLIATPAVGAANDQPPLHVEVTQDQEGQKGLSSANELAISAFVTEEQTGTPVAQAYTLEAFARLDGVADRTVFHLSYPYEIDPAARAGRYFGVIIVPKGGRWTVVVNVFVLDRLAPQTKIPVALATGELTVDVKAGTLPSAGSSSSTRIPSANRSEVAVRLLHAFVGLAWFALALLLTLVGLPKRVLLSGALGGLIERNLGRLGVALVWLTGLVWATGLLNLQNGTAFPPPLSTDQAQRLFLVPYARPYIYSLYLKIVVTAVITVLTFPIVRRARRMVEGQSGRAGQGWGLPLVVAVGGATVLICVTLLTYIHALSERVSAVVR